MKKETLQYLGKEYSLRKAHTPVIVYIAGPMTGYENQNVDAFINARIKLMELGYTVIDPPQIKMNFMGVPHPEVPIANAPGLRADILALTLCNAICLLPGWEQSRGARLECAIAITLGFDFIDIETGESCARPPFVAVTHGYAEEQPDGPHSYTDMWIAVSILINNVTADSYADRAEKLLKAAWCGQSLQAAVKKYALAFGVNADRHVDFELTDEEIKAVRSVL